MTTRKILSALAAALSLASMAEARPQTLPLEDQLIQAMRAVADRDALPAEVLIDAFGVELAATNRYINSIALTYRSKDPSRFSLGEVTYSSFDDGTQGLLTVVVEGCVSRAKLDSAFGRLRPDPERFSHPSPLIPYEAITPKNYVGFLFSLEAGRECLRNFSVKFGQTQRVAP